MKEEKEEENKAGRKRRNKQVKRRVINLRGIREEETENTRKQGDGSVMAYLPGIHGTHTIHKQVIQET